MISHEQRVSLLESLFRKSGMSLPELDEECPEILEDLIEAAFDDLQRSKFQLRRQISALRARNRALEDYVHMVAHDLKEPLVVMAFASNLVKNVPDLSGEKLKEYLQQIEITGNEMKRIINSLLLFAQVSEVEAPLEPVHMEQVVANVQDRLGHMIREQQAKIILPEMWPLAIGYGPWIEEVWTNYLSNALKYGGRPPRIELGASTRTKGVVRFWVHDNGPGIPPLIRTRLFTSVEHIGGLKDSEHGLGLSIVSRIVKKLGGRVGVKSEIGAGSRFFFTLPAVA